MDEDGESSEEEPQTVLVSSGREHQPTKSAASTTSPMPFVGADLGSHLETSSVEHNDGENQDTTAEGPATMTRASEGIGNGRHAAGDRSRLQQGARVSRGRVARLWSKLRAVAYITSIQVG